MSASTSPLHGAVEALGAALDHGVRTVAAMHRAIAGKPFAALRRVPAVGAGSSTVQAAHDVIAGTVYASIGVGLQLLGGAARTATRALPAREPRGGSAAAAAVAALNGFVGDRLERRGNGLATSIGLRRRGRALAVRRAALTAAYPNASSRPVLFVHGLACDESMWAASAAGEVDFGARIERELGCTPLYLRYNTGLPIAENGRRLSRLLDELVAEWPQPIEELILIGHSMGGLVLRSAAHQAGDAPWCAHVRHVFYLGSPHRGAPLEKATNVAAWLLRASDVTRPLAALLDRRSRGIKDLRFGALRDEDWGADVDALLDDRTADLPLLAGARHHFIVATVTRDARHPLGVAVGDLLVRTASAKGRTGDVGLPFADVCHVGATSHIALLRHPAVYAQIRRVLSHRP